MCCSFSASLWFRATHVRASIAFTAKYVAVFQAVLAKEVKKRLVQVKSKLYDQSSYEAEIN